MIAGTRRPSSRSPFRRSSSSRPSRCTCSSTPPSSGISAPSPLGGLAVGGGLLAWAAALLNFLAYGTTARAARRAGAGDRAGAVAEGVQATWLALGLGLVVLVLFQVLAGPLTRLLAGGAGAVAEAGEEWLRIASLGAPLLLVSLAGNGWLRGVQELRRPVRYVLAGSLREPRAVPAAGATRSGSGLVGSAVANVAGQAVTAGLFLRALAPRGRRLAAAAGRPAAPSWSSAATCCCAPPSCSCSFLVAAGVAARAGTAQLGAHQIALQLFFFLALVLDAYAIAAQTLVGHALGGDRPGGRPGHRPPGRALGARHRAGRRGRSCSRFRDVLLPLFTDDAAVLAQAEVVWWFLAAMQPLAGVVFALDGVLMGAGDVGYLRTVTIGSAAGRLPAALLLAAAARLGAGRGLDRAVPVHRPAAGRRPRPGGG